VGGGGIVLAAVGAVLFVVTRPSGNHPAATGFHITPTGDGAVIGIHGVF
jgi:hypothetical protein